MNDGRRDENTQDAFIDSVASPFFVFLAISALNFFRIGYQLVAVAWLAVHLTGRVDAAGQVLLVSTLTSFAFAPLLGKLADAYANKRRLLVCGHIGIVLSGFLPSTAMYFTAAPGLDASAMRYGILISALVLTTISAILASVAMDYFIKSCIPASIRMQRLASLNTVTQIALIVGTGFGGAVVALTDFGGVFLVISASGAGVALICWRSLPNLIIPATELSESTRPFFTGGPLLYFRHPGLFAIACCSALVFSVGQITNTLLPALIKFHWHRDSFSYSLIEAAWSIGAFCVSVLFAGRIRQSMGRNAEDLGVVAIMAVLLAAVSQLNAFGMLLALHFILGMSFALVRIRSEVRFLAFCPTHLLGRFRANSLFLTSAVGLVVFSAPLVFNALSIPMLYVLLAGMVLASVIVVLFFIEMRHSSRPSDECRETR